MYLNTPVPHFYAYVRKEFLYNLESGHGEVIPVMVFGIASVPGRALGWHVMTDAGAVFWRLPIHALCSRPDAPTDKLDNLQLWDCFGDRVSITTFGALHNLKVQAILKDKRREEGTYMFTVDWWDNPYSDAPEQNKCAHVIRLDNGNYAALPNNRILWAEPSFVQQPFAIRPDYKVNTHLWKCETLNRWAVKGEDQFYELETSD